MCKDLLSLIPVKVSAPLTFSGHTWTFDLVLNAVQVRKKFEALKKSKEAVQPDLDVADGMLQ